MTSSWSLFIQLVISELQRELLDNLKKQQQQRLNTILAEKHMNLMKFKSFFLHIRSAVHGVHYKIKSKEMGGARGMHGRNESCT